MTAHGLLWLFVVNLGLVCGAGLYEARVTVSRWLVSSVGGAVSWHPDEAQRDDPGRRFWLFVTTVPLTLLTVGNGWAAWKSSGALQSWWLGAVGWALVDRVATFGYFIPRMVKLLGSADSVEARARMRRWAAFNWLRLLAVSLAWLAALRAFAIDSAGGA